MKNKWLFILIFALSNCRQPVVFKQTKDIDAKGWHKDSIVQLDFKPQKKHGKYNIFFLIRNDNNYPYANIFLIANLKNGHRNMVDTLEYEMADAKGNWLGSGIWDLKESKLIYRKNFAVEDTLPVHISVQQAVRKSGQILGDEYLPGIKTVGIIIEEKTE